jgi:hypothetical protein
MSRHDDTATQFPAIPIRAATPFAAVPRGVPVDLCLDYRRGVMTTALNPASVRSMLSRR